MQYLPSKDSITTSKHLLTEAFTCLMLNVRRLLWFSLSEMQPSGRKIVEIFMQLPRLTYTLHCSLLQDFLELSLYQNSALPILGIWLHKVIYILAAARWHAMLALVIHIQKLQFNSPNKILLQTITTLSTLSGSWPTGSKLGCHKWHQRHASMTA